MTEENKEVPKDDMEPMKPPTVPLFVLPDAVLNSMRKEVTPDTGMLNNPVEWIMKQRKMSEAQVSGPMQNTPPMQVAPAMSIPQSTVPVKKEKVPKVAWGGNDLNEEALTMLFYMVVKEVSKDKKIKKYLKDLNIEIYDINQTLLWP
jgi:hypothetical protein